MIVTQRVKIQTDHYPDGAKDVNRARVCYGSRLAPARISGAIQTMAEKLVLVGVLPEVVLIDAADQVVWVAESGNLRIEFDPQRCPFSSNVFQAPAGVRLMSGTTRAGLGPGRSNIDC